MENFGQVNDWVHSIVCGVPMDLTWYNATLSKNGFIVFSFFQSLLEFQYHWKLVHFWLSADVY